MGQTEVPSVGEEFRGASVGLLRSTSLRPTWRRRQGESDGSARGSSTLCLLAA